MPGKDQAPSSESTGSSSDDGTKQVGGSTQDVMRMLQQANQAYWSSIWAAYSDAQTRYVQAVLSYFGAIQREQENIKQGHSSEKLKEIWAAWMRQDSRAYVDALQNHLASSYGQEASVHKAVGDAAVTCSEAVGQIYERLQGEIQKQNASLADAVKDALLRADVRPTDIPALAALYQVLRTGTSREKAGG